jgi:hypothetical protein
MADLKNTANRNIRNKTLKMKSGIRSESFFNYTQTQGDNVISAFARAGVIFLFCANDQELLNVWSEWFDKTISAYDKEVAEVKTQVEQLRLRLPSDFELPEIEIPENYVWRYDVSTPQVCKLASIVLKMDELMAEVECLWLLGQVESIELSTARNQAIGAVKRLLTSIYTVTNKGKRNNGPYRAAVFMELFRAQRTLPLNKSDKKIIQKENIVEVIQVENLNKDEVGSVIKAPATKTVKKKKITDKVANPTLTETKSNAA